MFLIEIHTGTGDGPSDMYAGQVVFYQGAAKFLVFPVNIVGPFDPDVFRIERKYLLQGQCRNL